jgi:hypothetical protein
MMYEQGNQDYEIWNRTIVVSDCLRKLGYEKLAKVAHKHATNDAIISSYIKLIANTARAKLRHDVLDTLCFAGLIYG